MIKLKLIIYSIVIYYTSILYADENILRIGGLDIPDFNYGTIAIGPHENMDKSEARFSNYYLELSSWMTGVKNGKTWFANGDLIKDQSQSDWRLSQRVTTDTIKSESVPELVYSSVFRDTQPAGQLEIEVTSKLYYQRYRDWGIFVYTLHNVSDAELNNVYFGLKMDADVPDEQNKPTHDNDRIGMAGNMTYLYDSSQPVDKSNIIGIATPTGKPIISWWNAANDPADNAAREQLFKISKQEVPVDPADYRVLMAQGPFTIKKGESVDVAFTLIESDGLDNAFKANEHALAYYEKSIAPGLRKPIPEITAEHSVQIATQYEMLQNYPNPFNPETTIQYSLPKQTHTTITVFNIKGSRVNTLVNGLQQAGSHSIVWNGCDANGQKVSSGIYYARIEAGEYQQTIKMILFQ